MSDGNILWDMAMGSDANQAEAEAAEKHKQAMQYVLAGVESDPVALAGASGKEYTGHQPKYSAINETTRLLDAKAAAPVAKPVVTASVPFTPHIGGLAPTGIG